MSQETEVLLRTILYQIGISKTLDEAMRAIKVMCSKDTIAVVEKEIEEYKKQNA